ncbi:MAG: beta-ketoacyl-[acyl-carrier-protein] synthase family protein [Planctomycetia bacterium]|nr:beta-ketoacyl-[acyl-carrier-protein] synthase family protein [Planctomycetia bacterium]
MMENNRVAITGLGPISPIGLGVNAFRIAWHMECAGVHPFRLFDASALPVRFGGEIEEFDAHDFVDRKDRKQLKLMVRTIQLAVAAARVARDDAALTTEAIAPERLGVMMGTGVIPGDPGELGPAARRCMNESGDGIDLIRWGRDGLEAIPPMWMLNHVPNMPACHVAILHNARGPNNTLIQYDAAALFAIIEARRTIQRGAADAVLAGGTDTRTNITSISRCLLFSEMSRRNDEPQRASRPFQRDRDGHVVAEGAGIVLLENAHHARRRGARVYAELVGTGMAFGSNGLARAIRMAMDEAGITPADVDHVNAAADGRADDIQEAQTIRDLLGDVPVLAFKSVVGNLGNGASGLELIASLVALDAGLMPASRNADTPDPACAVNLCREPRRVDRPCVIKLARTDRGQYAVVVIRREV